jgi:hypothetical protein
MQTEDDQPPAEKYEIPRQGFFASMPKRSLSRILILLAALVGIIYLQQRTHFIAGCMADAFRAPVSAESPSTTMKARVVLPSEWKDGSP